MRNGELYQLEVRFKSKRRMVFRDSLKLLYSQVLEVL
jgi:hypothetical protein